MEVSNTWFQQWKTASTQPRCFGVSLASPSPAKQWERPWGSTYGVSVMLPERSGLLQLDLFFPLLFHGTADPKPAHTTAWSAPPPFYHYQGPGKPGQAHKASDWPGGWKRRTTGCPGQECPVGSKRYRRILTIAKIRDPQLHMTPRRDWMRKDEGTFLACLWHLQSTPDKTNIPQTPCKHNCSWRKSRHKVEVNTTTSTDHTLPSWSPFWENIPIYEL